MRAGVITKNMQKDYKEYPIWTTVSPQTVTSSTDATPIVVTKAAHGYSTGDTVLINGHATNIAANGIFKIIVLSSSTFSLVDINTGLSVAGSGAGAGSGGVMIVAPKILLTQDFTNAELQIATASSGNMTVKVAGSLGKNTLGSHGEDTPNFGGTVSAANNYTFLQLIDLQDNSSIDGNTGFVVTGTDAQKLYEINVNAIKYLTLIPTAWSAGSITAKIILYSI